MNPSNENYSEGFLTAKAITEISVELNMPESVVTKLASSQSEQDMQELQQLNINAKHVRKFCELALRDTNLMLGMFNKASISYYRKLVLQVAMFYVILGLIVFVGDDIYIPELLMVSISSTV